MDRFVFLLLALVFYMPTITQATVWKGETKVIPIGSSIPTGWIAEQIIYGQQNISPNKILIENITTAPYKTTRTSLRGMPIPTGWVILSSDNYGNRTLLNTNNCNLNDSFIILESSPYTIDFYPTYNYFDQTVHQKAIQCIRNAPVGYMINILPGLIYSGWSTKSIYGNPPRILVERKIWYTSK